MVLFRGYQPYWSPGPESPESGVWLAVSADDLLRGPPDYVWVWPGLVTSCQSEADFLCRRTKRDYWLRDTFGVCYPCHLFSWLDNVSKDKCLIEKQKQNQAPHFLKHIILGYMYILWLWSFRFLFCCKELHHHESWKQN